MIKFIFLTLSFIFLNFAHSKLANKEEWTKITEKEGFKIYSKSMKESEIRAMKIKGTVNGSILNVTNILRDVDSATDWIPNLISRKYVQEITDTEAILHDVTDMPWPVSNRDTIVHHKLSISENKKSLILQFNSVKHPDFPETNDNVRAHIHFGKIVFTPKGEDKTHIEMVILVDPRGSIPTWAVNVLQVSMPYDFVKALHEFAENSKIPPRQGLINLVKKLIKLN